MTALTNNTTTAFTTAPANPNLIFEGVGSETEEANGMSCRMRTRLKSPTHGVISLEIMAAYKGKYATQSVQNSPFEFHGVVMHATHENSDAEYNERVLRDIENNTFLYTKDGIVKFVNKTFGMSYETLTIDYDVRVHETKMWLC